MLAIGCLPKGAKMSRSEVKWLVYGLVVGAYVVNLIYYWWVV
jgi:hypothetical protein